MKFFFFLLLLPISVFATSFSVMTFNIENGGAQVSFNQTVEAIKKSGADIVGIQEPWGNTIRLANALGWKYADPLQHIISRYPILIDPKHSKRYVFIELEPGKVVAMANMHLPDYFYGPDLIKHGKARQTIESYEKIYRLPTALPFIKNLKSLVQSGVPVFLTGDFNSPSHLDWTKTTVNVLSNHPYVVIWPVTKTLEVNGLIDSFRALHPDVIADQGATWPGGRPKLVNTIDHFNPSANDLSDRIDFIFSSGKARPKESFVVGEKTIKPWPSDHRAVVTRFEVAPVTSPIKNLMPIAEMNHPQSEPSITVSKAKVKIGESFTINWKNAPGDRYDYIRIYSAKDKKSNWDEVPRLYTRGEINGSMIFKKANASGNWLAWNQIEKPLWPLAPGKYRIQLMLDDSLTILASTAIQVVK